MKSKLIIIFVACVSLLSAGFVVPAHVIQDQETEQAEQLKSEARRIFMRGKLSNNQKIVEGLSLKDFELVREGADGVTELVKGQHWFVLNTPEYRRYSEDMTSAAKKLRKAADDRNIEAAALRYFDLTLSCIDCHQYLETQGQ